mmetsp:Transcript_58993/g.118447  ORF Transcript_58993/g.118447 Transcript_58993/m.118447 type:complete len:356 (+) Transcript_58993:109-1176(+)
METWIGLFRNGFCVLHDFEIAGQSLFQPIQSFFPNMKVMNTFIAPLQAAAVYFNFMGGLALYTSATDTGGVAAAWSATFEEEVALRKSSTFGTNAARVNLKAATVSARENYWLSWCLFALAFGFTWLVFNSLKMVYVDLLNVGLILMEVALVFFLGVMAEGVRATWAKAKEIEALAAKIAGYGAKTTLGGTDEDAVKCVATVAGVLQLSAPPPPWPASAAPYLAKSYVEELEVWRTEVVEKASTAEGKALATASLRAKATGDVLTGWLDTVLILLNAIAFLGYFVFPVTYLISEATLAAVVPWWPGNEAAEWLGNLVGDAAWTVEPALVLLLRPYIASVVASKTKHHLGNDKKDK